ncbi:MAG: hypothetical protein DWQ01_15650 [Planctomycetota bacterium]|nr:MAG: hypothetical protein DWQ01_15650 [Planctomycetota bacterium]
MWRSLLASLASLVFIAGLQAQSVYPKGTTVWQQGSTYDGYTIFTTMEIPSRVVMIDMEGTEVHSWESPVAGFSLHTVDPLESGSILAYTGTGPGIYYFARTIGELDFDGNVLWTWSLPPEVPQTTVLHHDSERLTNGNTMLMGSQEIVVPSISSKTIIDDFLIEVAPNGSVVWVWEAWRHFDELGLSQAQKDIIARDAGDWAHINSVDEIPSNDHTHTAFAEGNLIVGFRNLNTILVLDRSSGTILWRLGADESHLTHGQHWPHMIEPGFPGAGNILVFDNGAGFGYAHQHQSPNHSRVIEIDPSTGNIVWSYQEDHRFWSSYMGGAQRLPNGNTLICSAVKGRLFEVDPAGNVVWEYMSPYNVPVGLGFDHRVYRAYRVPYSWKPR